MTASFTSEWFEKEFCCTPPNNFKHTISNSSFGQKRTAKHKALVFLSGRKVYKGPYSLKQIKKLVLVLFRHQVLENVFNDNLPKNLQIFRFDDQYYFEMDHITYENDFNWQEESCEMLGFENEKHIVTKESQCIMELSTYLKQDHEKIQFQVVWSGFWHFVHRYLLGIGDASLRNVLVDVSNENHVVYGIDYEDNRGNEPQQQSELFELLTNKRWSKQHKDVFQNMLCESKETIFSQLEILFKPIFIECQQIITYIEEYSLQNDISIEMIRKRTMLLINSLEFFYKK